MLGAHLDSWHTGTGATDNADGSAVVMEAFRILKATGLTTKRTLRLALWSGEEQGLLGARAYVRAHLDGDANKPARDRLSVYFNIDPGQGADLRLVSRKQRGREADLRRVAGAVPGQGRRAQERPSGHREHGSSCVHHRPGMPGFNPIQDYVDYDVREHHTNADTAERIKEADLRQNAMILAVVRLSCGHARRDDSLAGPPMKSRWVGVTIGLLALVLVTAVGHALG